MSRAGFRSLLALGALVVAPAAMAQNPVADALGTAPVPKVTPPSAAATVKPGEAGGSAAAAVNPELVAAIDAFKAIPDGPNFDAIWNDGGRLSGLAQTDPKAAARELNILTWTFGLNAHVRGLAWPRGDAGSLPARQIRVRLVTADGTTINFPDRPLRPNPSAGATTQGAWAGLSQSGQAEGDNVRIRSALVLDGGQFVDAPEVVVPTAGGARTVNLTGGGSLTVEVLPPA